VFFGASITGSCTAWIINRYCCVFDCSLRYLKKSRNQTLFLKPRCLPSQRRTRDVYRPIVYTLRVVNAFLFARELKLDTLFVDVQLIGSASGK